ncbi:MAG TPA: hypothetical protein VL282_08695 [Tepidisphaeraceae bacterium]|jgi:capsular exopolysaccharide synthesis family protein|nr:hypothetical protein [Tepidisphaeraceae bacterium]
MNHVDASQFDPNDEPVQDAEFKVVGEESTNGEPRRNGKPKTLRAGGSSGPRKADVNLARLLQHSMRGRYGIAMALGFIFAIAAGALGWKLIKPQYHSTGLVRISYEMPQVIAETDQNRPLIMFDTFLTSQKLLITSRRVMDSAVQDPIWKATGRPVPLNPDSYFAEHLTVDIKPRSEFIAITVTDADPGTAAAAVTSIINAYSDLYTSQTGQLERQRIGVLEENQTKLQGQIDQLQKDILAKAQEFGTTKLDLFYDAAAERVTKLQAALGDVRLALATAALQPAPVVDGVTKPSTTQPAVALTVQQISITDPVMRAYLDQQGSWEAELARLTSLGYGPAHRSVQSVQRELDAAKGRVEKYAKVYREYHEATAQNLGEERRGPVETAGKTPEMLRANAQSLEKLHDEAKDEMIKLGNKKLELERQAAAMEILRTQLSQLTRRLDVLRAEGSLGGRLSVISTGEIALSPDKDFRVKYAAASAGLGFLLPAAAIVLWSIAWRRYRYSDETEGDVTERAPLLGILPELNLKRSDREGAFAAAHSIHQIRVSLQSQRTELAPQTYLVTSAAAAEGKTSVVMGLGLSFAASRLRTLVVDADLVGHRMTSSLDAKDRDGLYELMSGNRIHRLLRDDGTGLHILTAGRAATPDAGTLSAAAIKSFLRRVRKDFDVVLIDTGPILGSVEAAIFAREVDGVIFMVNRGQDREPVQAAMRRLRSLGAKMSGVIFNRARPQDLHRSVYSSSYRSLPDRSSMPEPEPEKQEHNGNGNGNGKHDRFGRFGPLVQAVVANLPARAAATVA